MLILQYIRKHIKTLLPLSIVVVVTLAAWLPRTGVPLEMDDTLGVVGRAYYLVNGADPATLTTMPDKGEVILNGIRNAFRDQGGRFSPYRPMDDVLVYKILFWPYSPMIPTLFNALILGLTAMFLYLLVLEVTKKRWIAVAAAILYAFSATSIRLTWYIIHSQIFINFFIVFGIYCYVRYVNTHRIVWFILMVATCIIAPYFRELLVILPLTIFIVMLLERKWNKPLLIALPLLILHAWFPSFIVNLLFYKHFVIQSQYRGLFVQVYGGQASFISNLVNRYTSTAFTTPFEIALFIGPVFTVLTLLGIVSFFDKERKKIKKFIKKKEWLIFLGIAAVICIVCVIFGLCWDKAQQSGHNPIIIMAGYILAPLFFLVIFVSGFKFSKLFSIWLLVSGGLFIFIYIGYDAHLWPASIPWIVIALLWIDYLFNRVKERASLKKVRSGLARFAYYAIICMLVIGFADQCLNVVSVSRVWHEIGGTMQTMGESLRNAPQNSMVVTNFYHGVDIEYFDHSRVQHYVPFPWIGYLPNRVVDQRLNLEIAISQHYPEKDIYFINELLDHPFTQAYFTDPPGNLQLIRHYDVYVRYFYVDPFKLLLPQQLWKRTSASELQGPYVLRGGPFYRQYHQEYDVFKLTSYVPRVLIAQQNVKGYDIYFYNGKYYGISNDIQDPSGYIERVSNGEDLAAYSGDTIEEVTAKITVGGS